MSLEPQNHIIPSTKLPGEVFGMKMLDIVGNFKDIFEKKTQFFTSLHLQRKKLEKY